MKTWGFGYEKTKKKAKEIYSQIGRIQCPALGDEFVIFASNGFNHLMRKGRIPRPRNEQKRRFALLPYVEKIIKNPKATILYEQREKTETINRHGQKTLQKSIANFWTFVEKVNDCTVKVVIYQKKELGEKYFLSVMGDDGIKIKKGSKKLKTRKSPK